jgi:hypothetical protein
MLDVLAIVSFISWQAPDSLLGRVILRSLASNFQPPSPEAGRKT